MEDLDTWQKYSFIFYDEVGIGRAKRNDNYEKYLPLHEDGRVSKQHCVIIQRGDCLYLMDDGSKNGTYLNGILVDRPTAQLIVSGSEQHVPEIALLYGLSDTDRI